MSTAPSRIVGFISGRVMLANVRHLPAPSTAAASLSSVGMACRPARKMIIRVPMLRQIVMIISAGRANLVSCSQSGPSMPKTASSEFSRPSSCRMYRQTTETATTLATTGA